MFTMDELKVINEALKIADDHYKEIMDDNKGNKNVVVANNRKQKSCGWYKIRWRSFLKEINKYFDKRIYF